MPNFIGSVNLQYTNISKVSNLIALSLPVLIRVIEMISLYSLAKRSLASFAMNIAIDISIYSSTAE